MRTAKQQRRIAAKAVVEFNRVHGIGTDVTYWPGVREGAGEKSTTRTAAQVLGGHTAVVWIEARPDCIALSHVEAS